MAYYNYKRVVYRKDYEQAKKDIEDRDGEEYENSVDYDGDAWCVTEYLLDAKDKHISELEAENERLRDLSDDTKRLEFIIKNHMRIYSLDMSGKHTWSGVGRPIGKGTTPREAIDAAMEGE